MHSKEVVAIPRDPNVTESIICKSPQFFLSTVLICVALLVIVAAVYLQVGNHQFLDYDDGVYVTDNPHVVRGITGENIIWAFTSVYAGNWHPLTWLSHMVDVQLYGVNPRGHHLTNVAIHASSSLLLFLFLLHVTGARWRSSFVAALFALHPLHVESVAWVAERKDVLSAFFWFLTLLLYAEYVKKRGERIYSSFISHLSSALYLFTLVSFVLGLMSKSMLVTLPLILLMVDYWPLGRYRDTGQGDGLRQLILLVKEKIPFFACSLCTGAITIFAQHRGGAMSDLDVVSLGLRAENALIAYVTYIGKTVWPRDLGVFYPLSFYIPLWRVISALLILLLISAAAIRVGRRLPAVVVGWFWFLITLLPVIGLIQVGGQSMADRYTYIPLTGLFVMAAWGVPELITCIQYREGILALFAGAVIAVFATVTWQQLGYWRNSISLYRHTLQVTTGNYWINYNLGVALAGRGDMGAAIEEYREALRINPGYAKAHNNLGFAFAAQGNLDAAIQEFREALRINPNDFDFHNNLGLVLVRKGNLDAAIREFREALRINPAYAEALNNLGVALAQKMRDER